MNPIRAGIYGLCVADALGIPAETRTREALRSNPITGMTGGGVHGQPAGYLELLDVITQITDDLYYGCNLSEYNRPVDTRDIAWEAKYVDITYRRKKND